jgi:hypothetical protein
MKFFRQFMIMFLMLMLSMGVGLFVAEASGINPFYVVGGFMALSFIPKPKGVLRIEVDLWQNFIAENLFRGMEFVKNAFNADQYVVGGRVVHIPNAGVHAGAKRNRANLPASIVKRSDTDVTYALDEFTTDPVLISNAESVELSYDKMASVLSDVMLYLRQLIGDWIPYKWAPATSIIRTTGAAVAAHLDSATGNRKLMSVADLRAAKTYLNKLGTAQDNRFALIDSNMLDQLVNELSGGQYKDFSRAYDPLTGVIGKLEGFNIIERSQTVRYSNASTPVVKDPDAAGAATDNATTLCWQQNAVEKAEGDIKFFETKDDPQFYGDIYSGLVRLGGRIRRNDEKGIVAIVQASTT